MKTSGRIAGLDCSIVTRFVAPVGGQLYLQKFESVLVSTLKALHSIAPGRGTPRTLGNSPRCKFNPARVVQQAWLVVQPLQG